MIDNKYIVNGNGYPEGFTPSLKFDVLAKQKLAIKMITVDIINLLVDLHIAKGDPNKIRNTSPILKKAIAGEGSFSQKIATLSGLEKTNYPEKLRSLVFLLAKNEEARDIYVKSFLNKSILYLWGKNSNEKDWFNYRINKNEDAPEGIKNSTNALSAALKCNLLDNNATCIIDVFKMLNSIVKIENNKYTIKKEVEIDDALICDAMTQYFKELKRNKLFLQNVSEAPVSSFVKKTQDAQSVNNKNLNNEEGSTSLETKI